MVAWNLLVSVKRRLPGAPVLAPLSKSPEVLPAPWQAQLWLKFRQQDSRTILQHGHCGPLRIQKTLYPEGASCCHAVIVHPPGGIAAGDDLVIDAHIAHGTHAVLSTPSATKWYGAFGQSHATQSIDLLLDGKLEWLPAETIVFNRAQVHSRLRIVASGAASMIGWDQLIFGRHASGESFEHGWFDQSLQFEIDGQIVWIDRIRLHGNDALFESPIGLAGQRSMATLWALRPEDATWDEPSMESIRARVTQMAWTCVHPRLLVARMVGEPMDLTAALQQARGTLRHMLWAMSGAPLRLWAT